MAYQIIFKLVLLLNPEFPSDVAANAIDSRTIYLFYDLFTIDHDAVLTLEKRLEASRNSIVSGESNEYVLLAYGCV